MSEADTKEYDPDALEAFLRIAVEALGAPYHVRRDGDTTLVLGPRRRQLLIARLESGDTAVSNSSRDGVVCVTTRIPLCDSGAHLLVLRKFLGACVEALS